MAKSSGAKGFEPRKYLSGVEHPGILAVRLGNSKTITIGDVVRINNAGLLDLVGAGNPALGVVVGIVDENDINPFSFSYVNNTGATLKPDDTVVTAADNSSRAHYLKARVIADPAGVVLFYNDANGDVAQTNLGQLFNVTASSDQIDQATASDTSGQFQLIELDPDEDANASKGLFRLVEGQLASQLGNSTTVISA
jgi:hypothetical protein